MTFTVQLFAQARDLAGSERVRLELSEQPRVRDVRQQLGLQFPPLSPLLPSLLIAVNERYVPDDQIVSEGDRVACFPPVSGG